MPTTPPASLTPGEYNLGETIARFSELLYYVRGDYEALYDRYIKIGPFGFYSIPIIAAATLLAMEARGEVDFDNDPNRGWVESTERIMNEIVGQAMLAEVDVPLDDEKWLQGVIRSAMGGTKDWSPRG